MRAASCARGRAWSRRRARDRRRARRRRAAARRRGRARRRRARGALRDARRARVPVRPVKGQVLRLRDPRGPGSSTARSAREHGLPRPARRRPLRARRDDGGARLGHRADGRRRLRAAARHERARARRARAARSRSSQAGLRPATPDNLPAIGPARSTGSSGRPATSATASCSRRSPPSWSRARWPASRCPDWAAPGRSARASRGCRHEGARQRRARRELADGATVAGAPSRRSSCRPPAAASRSPSTPRSSPRAVGRRTSCTTARGSRSCARSREADRMTATDDHRRRRSTDRRRASSARGCCSAPAASARSRRWPRAIEASGDRARHRRAAARRSGPARLDRRRARRARASRCCRTPPAASPRATRCSPRSSPARRSRPTGSSSR